MSVSTQAYLYSTLCCKPNCVIYCSDCFSFSHSFRNLAPNSFDAPLSFCFVRYFLTLWYYYLLWTYLAFLPQPSVSQFSSVQPSVQFSRSVVSDSLRPRESQHARPPCPSPTPGVHSDSRPLSQWCHPAISSSGHPLLLLPPIPPSIRVFSNESTLRTRWPNHWSFSFSIIPSKEIPGLISFRMDWLDLLAVQGTLKSLLQHHSSKTSILQRSAFFTVQLSHS